jgi:hypothetical protein
VNVFLVKAWYRARFRRSPEFFDAAVLPESNPEDLNAYLLSLVVTWGMLASALGLACVGLAYLLDMLAGHRGRAIGSVTLAFVLAFCISGAIDAAWRYWVVETVCRRNDVQGELDDQTTRLLRLARLNSATLILQLAAATIVAVLLAVAG